MRRSKVKCPNCLNSENLVFVEVWQGHTISFEQQKNGEIDPIGYMGQGAPYKVEAKCVCGKVWTIRGAIQITDLVEHPGYKILTG